ncbi:SDR family NAD(P)-dependent oxidoreductase [Sphingomonas immobilis]|uniref:SDR family oxidoreductase n=1 Tax=Sphingomonas immobilis TaxID=3063997 RepID=A0ABT8ZYP6_9SPHN|nr:SDR family oxidoreductase [Sphingomonas sp. CA1-15]MDO7842239.1 SDR family oxidoreductase [Sphingomonas sp. CA1-15]
MNGLAGRVAIVSGSGNGIGRAAALKLASAGAAVVINDLDPAAAQAVADEIVAGGGRALACAGNVVEPGFAERFVAAAIDGLGGLDIIVNNAGYARHGMVQNTPDELFDAMIDVHLTAPFRLLRAAAPFIRSAAKREAAAGGGHHRKVVNVSSGSIRGAIGHSGYAAGKMGLVGLTNVIASEWGPSRVNVNAVAFGLIRTRMNAPLAEGETRNETVLGAPVVMGMTPERFADVESRNHFGRAGTPEEAAGAIYLFCTPESDFITGQLIYVSG